MHEYRKLVFQEISETQHQAVKALDCGYQIQITREMDDSGGLHNCVLWNDKNSIVDSEEGQDQEGVIDFISRSEDFVESYKECMIGDQVEL